MTPFSYILLLLVVLVAVPPAAASNDSACLVLDQDGQDVTMEVYDESLKLVNCTGERACYGYEINHCAHLYCDGMEACNKADIRNITGDVRCFEEHACHHTQIHAIPSSPDANVQCIGSGACDVAIMTNMNHVVCNGNKSCRQARIHADMVQCSKGDPGGMHHEACSDMAAFIVKDCLYCGSFGCPHVINMCRYRISDESVAIDYWDTHWEADDWTKCPQQEILGQCLSEWHTQYEEELHGLDEVSSHDTQEEGA